MTGAEQTESVATASRARLCSQCKAPDRAIHQPGERPLHFVVPEIRYLLRGEPFKESLRHGGWHPRKWQGQEAMERMICRDCLDSNLARDRVWAQLKDAARKMEGSRSGNTNAGYYAALCEV